MWDPIPCPSNDDMTFAVSDKVTMARKRPKNNYECPEEKTGETDPQIVRGFRDNRDPLWCIEDGIDICESPENTSDNRKKDPSAEEEDQDD